MRTVHFNKNLADVQSVKKRKSLRQAVVVALMAGTVNAWATNIEVGDGVTLVIRKDGKVCSWGSNYAGRLGDGSKNDSPIPLEIVGLSNITSVAAGGRHNMALDNTGTVWAWGESALGQVGNNSLSGSLTPTKVDMTNLKKAKSIAANAYESFAVDESDTVWAWGYNYAGFLGVGAPHYAQSTPFKGNLSPVAKLDAHGWHTLALDANQNVWSWGKNDKGEVGAGSISIGVSSPVKLMQAQSAKAGREFAIVLKPDNTVWGWGKNDVGQLGNGSTTDSLQPTQVIFPSGIKIVSISAGDYHALAIDDQGQLWSWGKNDHGQLGNGSTVSFSNIPVKVATDTGLANIAEFSAGLEHSAVLKQDGTVCVWGWGTLGQIGDGKNQDAFKPVCDVLNINNNYCASPPKDTACGGVTNGLVACYPFDGNANDGSGNGLNGSVIGTTLTADRLGNAGRAYYFDGKSYINVGNSPKLDVNYHTITAWIKPEPKTPTVGSNSGRGIVGKVKPYTYETLSFGLSPDNHFGTGFATGNEVNHALYSKDVAENNQWHFVAMSYDGAKITFYRDGLVDTSHPRTGIMRTTTSSLAIGRHGGDANQLGDDAFFKGTMDDVRIYNRALTEAEIKQLYGVVSTQIVATPPATICAGSNFDVTIRVNKTDAQAIDGAELALKFDKSKLKVNKVTNSGVFDTVLDSKYDNTTGNITFTAGAWNKPAATSSFDLFTINFTALSSTAGTTLLDFVNDSIMLTSGGQAVTTTATDQTLTLNQCLNYKVNLKRANAKGDPSWMTPMKVSLGSATSAVEYDTTCDVNGLGKLILSKPVGSSDYICVKNSHTLANKLLQPFGKPVDFGTLLEGDATNNNTVDILDFSFLTTHKGCKGAASTQYDSQADLNVSACVDQADLDIYKPNYKKPSACAWNDSLRMYRKGERKVENGENTLTLSAVTVPAGLKVGDSFDYTIQVNANEAQPADGVALYLNFDPSELRVNRLTTDTSFDVTLENTFDNTKGEINVAAGVWQNQAPTTSVDLVTINFTALQAGEHAIAFNNSAERETMIAYAGEDVTGFSENGKVVVEPIATVGDYTASGQLLGRTGIPLGNVTIHIGEKTTTTDAAGNWSLSGLTAGKYDIVATKGKQSCVDSAVELLDNGQYQQMVNYACDLVTYGDDNASFIAIWQSVDGNLQYVDTVSVEDFNAKFQEHRDYEIVDSNGEYLLEGLDDTGNTTSKIEVVRTR